MQTQPSFFVRGQRLLARPAGRPLLHEIRLKSARTSFLPNIVQVDLASGPRPPERRWPRPSSNVIVHGNTADSSCKSGMTNKSSVPSLPWLPCSVGQAVSLDKPKPLKPSVYHVPRDMPALEPACIPVKPTTSPEKIQVVGKSVTLFHRSSTVSRRCGTGLSRPTHRIPPLVSC